MSDYYVVGIILFFSSLILIIIGTKTYKKFRKLSPSELKEETDKSLDKSSSAIFFSSLFQSLLEIFKL